MKVSRDIDDPASPLGGTASSIESALGQNLPSGVACMYAHVWQLNLIGPRTHLELLWRASLL